MALKIEKLISGHPVIYYMLAIACLCLVGSILIWPYNISPNTTSFIYFAALLSLMVVGCRKVCYKTVDEPESLQPQQVLPISSGGNTSLPPTESSSSSVPIEIDNPPRYEEIIRPPSPPPNYYEVVPSNSSEEQKPLDPQQPSPTNQLNQVPGHPHMIHVIQDPMNIDVELLRSQYLDYINGLPRDSRQSDPGMMILLRPGDPTEIVVDSATNLDYQIPRRMPE